MNILKELKEYYNESPREFVAMFVYTMVAAILTVMFIILASL
jgi:hypothetical protein